MKSSLYVGFKVQIAAYEPMEIGASAEIDHDDKYDKEVINQALRETVTFRLESQVKEITKLVVRTKKKIIEELSDDEW